MLKFRDVTVGLFLSSVSSSFPSFISKPCCLVRPHRGSVCLPGELTLYHCVMSLVILFALKSTLPDISIATLFFINVFRIHFSKMKAEYRFFFFLQKTSLREFIGRKLHWKMVKGNSSARKNTMPYENLNPYKGMR